MTPEKFARCLIGLALPLTEEEWYGLINLLERLQPGIADCLDADSIKKRRNDMNENEKDLCILCGKETSYNKNMHVGLRENYVDGGGQLCNKYADKIYK